MIKNFKKSLDFLENLAIFPIYENKKGVSKCWW
jgi:hypothetical protein